MSDRPAAARGAFALLASATLALLLTGLGANDLWAPDEPRYGAVAENVRAASGPRGFFLLHLNGEAYTQKPPLYFWLAAAAGAPLGRVTETAARLPSALSGVALVGLVAWAGTRALGPATGSTGGALLLTSWEIVTLARRAQLDVLLTSFTTLALFAFWQLDRAPPASRAATRCRVVLHAALGLAVLTKGPVGLLVPALVIVAFLASEGRLATLRALVPPWTLALSVAPALLWLAIAVSLAPGGFFGAAVVENLWGRFFHGTSHARPFYYYLYQFPLHALPWTPLWLVVWRMRKRALADPRRARLWRFGLIWIGVALVFFSLSSGKRALYLLPAFPPAALLSADAVVLALRERVDWPRWITLALGALAAAVGVAGACAPALAAARGLRVPLPVALATVGFAVASIALGWRLGRAARPALARFAAVVAGIAVLEGLLLIGFLPALDAEKSPRPVARAAASRTRPDEPIGLYRKRALTGGLEYYGARRVVALSTAADVADFRAAGGRVAVVPAKHLARFETAGPVAVRARSRSGSRELLVVEALSASTPGGG